MRLKRSDLAYRFACPGRRSILITEAMRWSRFSDGPWPLLLARPVHTRDGSLRRMPPMYVAAPVLVGHVRRGSLSRWLRRSPFLAYQGRRVCDRLGQTGWNFTEQVRFDIFQLLHAEVEVAADIMVHRHWLLFDTLPLLRR